MKVVAFNGSPRAEGNTSILIKHVFSALEKEGIETELVHIGGKPMRGCTACYECYKNKNMRCIIESDSLNQCVEKMRDADGIILGSPTYVCDITSEMKALIDRACLVVRANGSFLRRKPGAAVVAVRRAGGIPTFDSLNHFFTISQMIVVGSNYWNVGIGKEIGDVENDKEGIQTMVDLGQNMAWLLKKLQ